MPLDPFKRRKRGSGRLKLAILSIHSSPAAAPGAGKNGGMSIYLRGLSRALGELDCRVDIFTGSGHGSGAVLPGSPPGVRLVTLPGLPDAPGRNGLYPLCPAIAAEIDLYCRSRGERYDIIFSHYWISGLVGQELKNRWKIPHLLMFHTLGAAKNRFCSGENEPETRLAAEEELARGCDLVIAGSERERDILLGFYDLPPHRIRVIPSGIDRDLFRPIDRSAAGETVGAGAARLILSVGRMEPVKGFDLLVRAAATLPEKTGCRVMIVGGDEQGGKKIESLREIARLAGCEDRLILPGPVAHDRLPFYYSAADLTVIPSYYESFGLAALESLACGTPVVSAPVGIIPEIITGGALSTLGSLVEGRCPVTWAAAIRRAMSGRPPGRADLDRVLGRFSWPEIARTLVDECRGLAARYNNSF